MVAGGESDELAVVEDDEEGFLGCNLAITARCMAFNVYAREWAYVEDMPLGVAHAASAVVGSKLYVAGGVFTEGLEEGLEDESDQLQIFDGVAWTSEKIELPSFGQDGSFGLFPGCACGAAWNGELVVVCGGSREHEIVPGGDDDEEPQFELVEALPRTYAYDVEARTWRALPALPEMRDGFSVAAHRGDLYVVGGVSDAACPPLVLRAGAAAWAPVPGAPDELGALERPALASVVLG